MGFTEERLAKLKESLDKILREWNILTQRAVRG